MRLTAAPSIRLLIGALLVALAATTLSTAALTPASADSSADGTPQLRREGRWLVDGHGRVVIVHGVNLVWKKAPYAPPATAAGFTAQDADWLETYGFNGARVGMLWAGVTPEAPGVADPAYFAKWDGVTDLLARRGIWTLFDGHQDQWHEQYGGEGAPAWAAKRPALFALAPPLNLPFPQGYWTPEVSTVFDSFWANRGGLLDGWTAYWRLVAEHYRDQPYSMGYDLFNEPWAGLEWAACLTLGCRPTYTRELQPAFTKALAQVRSADPDNMVWWEPQQFAGGQMLNSYFTAVPGERNLGLSWHNYCPQVFLESTGLPGGNVGRCRAFSQNRAAHALDQGSRMDAATLMTEFGATDNVEAIGIDVDVAADNLMGWTYWAYKHWDDPTTADHAQGLFVDDADLSTVKQDKLRALVETYPQATAGTPQHYAYDPDSGVFDYRYTADPSVTAPTDIFVSPLTTAHGYTVRLSNARVVEKSAAHLLVEALGPGTVEVHLTPNPA